MWKKYLDEKLVIAGGEVKEYYRSECIDYMLKNGKTFEQAINKLNLGKSEVLGFETNVMVYSENEHERNKKYCMDYKGGWAYTKRLIGYRKYEYVCIASYKEILHQKFVNQISKGCQENNTKWAVLVTFPEEIETRGYRIYYVPTEEEAKNIATTMLEGKIYRKAYTFSTEFNRVCTEHFYAYSDCVEYPKYDYIDYDTNKIPTDRDKYARLYLYDLTLELKEED